MWAPSTSMWGPGLARGHPIPTPAPTCGYWHVEQPLPPLSEPGWARQGWTLRSGTAQAGAAQEQQSGMVALPRVPTARVPAASPATAQGSRSWGHFDFSPG